MKYISDIDLNKPKVLSIAGQIGNLVDDVLIHLSNVRVVMEILESDGMYPAVPREQFESRNDRDPIYLHMIFRRNRYTGKYEGPGGKRKIYVGCKESKIAAARKLVANRLRYNELFDHSLKLTSWLSRVDHSLTAILTHNNYFPRIDLPELKNNLGPLFAKDFHHAS